LPITCVKKGSLTKKTVLYENRDEDQRQQFIAELAQEKPELVVFLDESDVDDNERPAYGYALKGKPCLSQQPGHKTMRHSFIAAVRADQPTYFVAPFAFEGYTNGLLFQTWLDQCIIPLLPEGTLVIMDNASFHKGERVKTLLEQAINAAFLFYYTFVFLYTTCRSILFIHKVIHIWRQ